MSRRLGGGKPRRFKDHRRREAKQWGRAYATVAERYPPADRLGAELVALAADMLHDYTKLRLSNRGTPSARRKLAGLVLGALRAAADGRGNGHDPGDLARVLQEHAQGRRGQVTGRSGSPPRRSNNVRRPGGRGHSRLSHGAVQ